MSECPLGDERIKALRDGVYDAIRKMDIGWVERTLRTAAREGAVKALEDVGRIYEEGGDDVADVLSYVRSRYEACHED